MGIVTQNKRYLPHEITTKVQSVKLYRQTKDIGFVCRRYHISKASLMRWNKLYHYKWQEESRQHLCCQNLGSLCISAKKKYRDRVMEEKERVTLLLCQTKGEHSRLVPQELCPLPSW